MWNYSMFIHNYGGAENTSINTYNEYIQMLYDRDPIFPEEIGKDSSVLRNLKRNTKQRVVEYEKQKKEYPHVLIEKKVDYLVTEEVPESKDMTNTKEVYVADYNFCYFRVKSVGSSLPKKIWMLPFEDCYLQCEFEETLPYGMSLYKVVNIDEISDDKEKMGLLQDWMEQCHQKAERNKVGWKEE